MSELVYRIDPSAKGSIRILLEERGALRKRILYPTTLKELAKEADKAPLQALIQAKRRATPGVALETLSCQQIDLEPAAAIDLLRTLIATGRLHIDSLRIEKACEAKIHWEAESFGSEACRVEPFFFTSQKIPLKEISWFFSTPSTLVALVGSQLLIAPYSGSVKWIEKGQGGPFGLEGMNKRRFLEEEFSIVWKQKEETPLTVYPELRLHDAAGCFADLWMEYPGIGSVAFSDLSPLIGSRKRLINEEKQWEKDLLEAGYLRKQVGRSPYYCPGEKASDALSLLFDVGWKIFDARGKSAVRFSDWSCEAKEEGGQIALLANPALQGALKALKENRIWSEQGDKTAWIDRREAEKFFGELLDADWKEGKLLLPKRRLTACLGLKALWQEELQEAVARLGDLERIEKQLPGPGFVGELLSYQQMGVSWLLFLHRFHFGGLLADEMGLGKTVQLLAFFSLLRTNLPVLIVAPTSLLYHWRSEFSRFLPKAQIKVHAGGNRAKQISLLQGECFVLTTYAILRQDAELFSQIEFESVVLDESNAIKNSETQTAQAALRLKAHSRFCLSGTPIENRVSELAAQFAFLMPDLIHSKDAPESMQQKSRPFLLRRRKGGVELDLPEKVEQIVWVEPEELQEEIYEEFQKSAMQRIKPMIEQDGAAAHRMEILEAILRLRQICCDPRLVGREAESAKLNLLKSDLQELLSQGSKALVYSQFTSMLDAIEESCSGFGYKSLRIDGSTPAIERAKAVEEFQKSPEPLFLLLSLKAGGVGLNLTAADYVLLFDPWWNEAVERQAIDRAHRIGRKKSVFIKRYLTPNSIEEKMLKMKEIKQGAADFLLDGGAHAGSLSADEWFELLN